MKVKTHCYHPRTVKVMNDIQAGSTPMTGWKNILVPLDFSESSSHALKMAAGLAEKTGAKLTLLHVIHIPACFPMDALQDMDDLKNCARDSLERMAREISPGLIRQKIVLFAHEGIAEEIIEAAAELSANLIVMTTHKHGRLARVLYECIAEKVQRCAPCPVLAASDAKDFARQAQLHPAV